MCAKNPLNSTGALRKLLMVKIHLRDYRAEKTTDG
jgi:hypothetical protein